MFTLDNFYKSDTWLAFRAQLMQERTTEHGLICEHCGQPILKPYDCIAHHKVELTEDNVNDYSISLNPDNVELIHFKCHNIKHNRWNGHRQRVFLIYGAPCSGKTEWIKANANEDDLVLDIESIWHSICTAKGKPNRLKANVFGIRDCLLDQIKTRTGQWRTAYVVGTYPLRTDRDRLCTLLNAEAIYIEATKQECLLRDDGTKEEYILEWFEDFVP